MFDGVGEDFDLRYAQQIRENQNLAALPVAVGGYAITKSSTPSYQPSPRGTAASRSRTALRDYQKEVTSATHKDVDELRHTIRRLEAKVQGLESRVQYVNPWAVQHMWNVLLKLQERMGSTHHHGPGGYDGTGGDPAAWFRQPTSPPPQQGGSRSCSPPTPLQPHLSMTLSTLNETMGTVHGAMMHPVGGLAEMREQAEGGPSRSTTDSAGGTLPSSPLTGGPYHAVQAVGIVVEEALCRQQLAVDASTAWHLVYMESNADLLQRAGLERAAILNTMTMLDGDYHTGMHRKNAAAGTLSPPQVWQHGSSPLRPAVMSSDDSPLSPLSPNDPRPRPKLRSQFVNAIIHDDGFTERMKFLLADFAQPLMEASQKRFIGDAERWMQAHTSNLLHESHSFTKELSEKWSSIQASMERDSNTVQEQLDSIIAQAKRSSHDDLVSVSRMREEVEDISRTVALKIAQLETWRDDLAAQMEAITERRLAGLVGAFRRIGEQQDIQQRRLDDLQSRQLLIHETRGGDSAASDGSDDPFDAAAPGDSGNRMVQALAYLDGLLLAPTSADNLQRPESYKSRLEDSVLLLETHDALTKLSDAFTATGSSKSKQMRSSHGDGRGEFMHDSAAPSGRRPATALGISLRDLPQRPVSLFPVDTITSVVVPLLMRHSVFGLRAEAARLKLPSSILRGLESVWRWLTDLSLGVVWRRLLRAEHEERFDVTEETAVVIQSLQMDRGSLLTSAPEPPLRQRDARVRDEVESLHSRSQMSSRATSEQSGGTVGRSISPQIVALGRPQHTALQRLASSGADPTHRESIMVDSHPTTPQYTARHERTKPTTRTSFYGVSQQHGMHNRHRDDAEPTEAEDFSYLYGSAALPTGGTSMHHHHTAYGTKRGATASTWQQSSHVAPSSRDAFIKRAQPSSRSSSPGNLGPKKLAFR